MKSIRRAALSLLTLVATSASIQPGLAQARAKQQLNDYGRYIEQVRADLGNVGVAVAVVHGDRVVFSQGFGVKEYGKPDKVGPDTLFEIGSTTKAFTPATLAILVDAGKLRWDDPVIDYLPGFQLQDPWLTRHLTVRDTVTHRSGIPDTPYFVLAAMSGEEAVRQLRYIPAEAEFRDSYRYSNLMFGVAGQIVAAVSGMSWQEFVKQRLLQPLQMSRSGASPYEFWDAKYVAPTFQGSAAVSRYSHKDARDGDVAVPHVISDGGTPQMIPWQSYDNAAGAGAIVSSANDMAHWIVMNLNEGRFEGRQILSPEVVKELHATQNLRGGDSRFPFEDAWEGYAMGWNSSRYHERRLLTHGGGIIGFPAFVALMPQEKIGVVVLANSDQAAAGDNQALRKAIALRAFDDLLSQPRREWGREFLARAQRAGAERKEREKSWLASRIPNAPASLSLDRYVGDYADQRLQSGPVKVKLVDGQLSLSFAGEGAYSATLEHWHHDVFRLLRKGRGETWGFVSFAVDVTGKVASLAMFDGTFDRLNLEQPR
jgi:CubicO group peptidase (beta-lactamase class C family)